MSEAVECKNKLIPSIFPIICMVLLLVALCKLPYGYYTLLRIALFLWGIIYGIKHHSTSYNVFLTTLSFGVSVLYNPIIVIHLARSHWSIINIITIFIVFLCSLEIKGNKKTDEAETSEKGVAIKPEAVQSQAWENISQLVKACLNIKVNDKELFKTTSEKIEALYYVMFMVKKELELTHNISKSEPCLLHLADLLSQLKVEQQDVVTLIKIWEQDRIVTYGKCNITDWAQTLDLLCIWGLRNGHTNATINNMPKIDTNHTTDNIEHTQRRCELNAWVHELMHANIYGIIAKDLLIYTNFAHTQRSVISAGSARSWFSFSKLFENYPQLTIFGVIILIFVVGALFEECSQKYKTIESSKNPYSIPMKPLKMKYEPQYKSVEELFIQCAPRGDSGDTKSAPTYDRKKYY